MANQEIVIGTTRKPDGDKSAPIDGLVLQGSGTSSTLIGLAEAIRKAEAGLLKSKVPGDGQWVSVVAVDENSDGVKDAVRTAPDKTRRNNLLDLPIWDRKQQEWIQ
jgi:hypothetical protein